MSEIKALEDMRNTVKTIAADCDEEWILGCLDEIEDEVNERFMELPLDADDVPIHVGDTLEYDYGDGINGMRKVMALIFSDRWDYEFDNEVGDTRDVNSMSDFYECNHHAKPRIKPRTLEDILEEFIVAYDEWDDDGIYKRAEKREEIFTKYVDEIRKLMKKDEKLMDRRKSNGEQ